MKVYSESVFPETSDIECDLNSFELKLGFTSSLRPISRHFDLPRYFRARFLMPLPALAVGLEELKAHPLSRDFSMGLTRLPILGLTFLPEHNFQNIYSYDPASNRASLICAAIPGWSESESRGCSGSVSRPDNVRRAERSQSLDTDRASATLTPSREWSRFGFYSCVSGGGSAKISRAQRCFFAFTCRMIPSYCSASSHSPRDMGESTLVRKTCRPTISVSNRFP